MHLLDFTLYGFGQFLQILLWIFLPAFVLSLLVTTYFHYRKKSRQTRQFHVGGPVILYAAESDHRAMDFSDFSDQPFPDQQPMEIPDAHTQVSDSAGEDQPDFSDTPYKGFLWMKNKYEEDRLLADAKYEQLKTDFRRSEERMAILMAEQTALRDLLEKKELRIVFLQSQLDDRQSWIEGQNERSQQEKTRYEELVAKLEFSSQLLLKIHKELDISKGLNSASGEPFAASGEPFATSGEPFTAPPGTVPEETFASSGIPAATNIPTGEDIQINEERTAEVRSLPDNKKIVSWSDSA
jgi:hypothetical protein